MMHQSQQELIEALEVGDGEKWYSWVDSTC